LAGVTIHRPPCTVFLKEDDAPAEAKPCLTIPSIADTLAVDQP